MSSPANIERVRTVSPQDDSATFADPGDAWPSWSQALPVQGGITVPSSTDDAGGRIPFEDVESVAVREAIGYWQGLCRGRRFPSRVDIRPREIRGLLRNTCLIRVLDGGSDYEYRVIGDAHVIAYGFSMQGKQLSEIDAHAPGHGQVLKRLYDRVVRKGEPYALRGWIERAGVQRKYIYSESLFAPLGDAEVVSHIFNVSVYVPKND
jgi:hypothetical protein